MGHLVGKDVYRGAARKLDSLSVRVPYNDTLRALLEEIYTPQEAAVVAAMPATPSTFAKVRASTGLPEAALHGLLERLCNKGLVIDLHSAERDLTLYQVSPFVIGVFEFTMMRTASDADHARRARLFQEYWREFATANWGDGQPGIARALPHEETLLGDHVEVLDYERASHIVEQASRFSVGLCSCRHEKHHLGERRCDVPLESCTQMDGAADYLVRRGLAREISRTEMQERIARSRELGLVLSADNIQNRVTFICHCCSCCCNVLGAINNYGCTNALVSSSFEAHVNDEACKGCGACAKACPVNVIEMTAPRPDAKKTERRPQVADACVGCGVCVTRCPTGGMQLRNRGQRVFHPANTFERVLLQSLEAGTLQHLVFDNPQSTTQGFLRGLVGGFLRLTPVKRALVSDQLRSTFLAQMANAARRMNPSGTAVTDI